MEKNIYDLLNNAYVDLDDYNKEQITDLEGAKMMKFMKEKMGQNNNTRKQKRTKTAVAASIAVLMLVGGTVGGVSVMATENPTAYKIANFLGIEKNLDSYESMINQSVTKDGVTLSLKGVIINGDELVASVVTSSPELSSDNFEAPGAVVFINGERINGGSMMQFKVLDEHTGHSIIRVPLLKQYEGILDVKLQLSTPLKEMERSPHWEFEFRTSGDELKEDTFIQDINETVSLPDGKTIKLNNFQLNRLSCTIDFSAENGLGGNQVEIYSVDEKGNEIKFELDVMTSTKGKLVLPIEYHETVEQAKTLNCTVVLNGEKLGQTFMIQK
ncbi:MAG: DUF4179 domain-containing protein [Aminipila sp.]